PKTVGQIPYNFPTKPGAQWEGEKTRVNGALYFFGHGLSYTTFAYSNLMIGQQTLSEARPSARARGSSPTVREGLTVKVWCDVTNTGPREGDEVVQLYTHELVTSVTTYEKNLRGFERVHLSPGETKTVSFTLSRDDLALWDRQMHFVVEPGKFKVMIGSGSEDIRLTGQFEIASSR